MRDPPRGAGASCWGKDLLCSPYHHLKLDSFDYFLSWTTLPVHDIVTFMCLKLPWQTFKPFYNLTVLYCNLVSSLPVSELLVLRNWFLSVWRSEHALSTPLQSLLLFYIDKPRVKSKKKGTSFCPFMCYQFKNFQTEKKKLWNPFPDLLH